MYKKELGGGVQLFLNGEDYFEMRNVGCTTKELGGSTVTFEQRGLTFTHTKF